MRVKTKGGVTIQEESRTGAEGEGGDAGHKVSQAHVIALPGSCVAQQPVAPPHRLRRLQQTPGDKPQQHSQYERFGVEAEISATRLSKPHE